MVVPKINSAHGSETRNIINAAIDSINVQGKTIQDLVADGQLTEEQYSNLINSVNGLIKSGEVTIYDINKNKGRFDQTYLTEELLQQIAGTAEINAVPADGSLTTEKYSDNSVTYDKQDFFRFEEDGKKKFKTTEDVTGDFVKEWISYESGFWTTESYYRSVITKIKPFAEITIETKGDHNRFSVFTSNNKSASEIGRTSETVYVKNGDGVSVGNESYTFVNGDFEYLIIALISGGTSNLPNVRVTNKFTDENDVFITELKQEQEKRYPPLTNGFENADFTNGTENWSNSNSGIEVIGDTIKVTATSKNGNIGQSLSRTAGEKYFVSADIKSNTNEVGIDLNGATLQEGRTKGNGSFEKVYVEYEVPTTGMARLGFIDESQSDWEPFEVKNPIYINLTKAFGAGNEPTAKEMQGIIDNYLNGFFTGQVEDYSNVNIVLDNHQKEIESLKSTVSSDTGITKTDVTYPVLFGVKMSNQNDVHNGRPESPKAIGWLYYMPESPYEILYSDGTPDNLKHLCYWDMNVTWDGKSGPEWYRPFITKDGDIIFVFRGDEMGLGSGLKNVRQNPIIYPANDWGNPVVVELQGDKPTSWLMNCGADYIYNEDVFIFSEYTRPSHLFTHTWRVTKPFTDPNNWQIVQSFELSGSNQTGMKHSHTINYDPFSGYTYLTTGDDDSASKIISSPDSGVTWNIEFEGNRRVARVLNFIFTKDKIYWANDDGNHGFFSADRNPETNAADFQNYTELYDLKGHPPTYVNALIEDQNAKPKGILILNRFDSTATDTLDVLFWEISTATMHTVAQTKSTYEEGSLIGFRVEACNYYQSRTGKEIMTGFASPRNSMDFLGNIATTNVSQLINNLALEVKEGVNGFYLDLRTVTKG